MTSTDLQVRLDRFIGFVAKRITADDAEAIQEIAKDYEEKLSVYVLSNKPITVYISDALNRIEDSLSETTEAFNRYDAKKDLSDLIDFDETVQVNHLNIVNSMLDDFRRPLLRAGWTLNELF